KLSSNTTDFWNTLLTFPALMRKTTPTTIQPKTCIGRRCWKATATDSFELIGSTSAKIQCTRLTSDWSICLQKRKSKIMLLKIFIPPSSVFRQANSKNALSARNFTRSLISRISHWSPDTADSASPVDHAQPPVQKRPRLSAPRLRLKMSQQNAPAVAPRWSCEEVDMVGSLVA